MTSVIRTTREARKLFAQTPPLWVFCPQESLNVYILESSVFLFIFASLRSSILTLISRGWSIFPFCHLRIYCEPLKYLEAIFGPSQPTHGRTIIKDFSTVSTFPSFPLFLWLDGQSPDGLLVNPCWPPLKQSLDSDGFSHCHRCATVGACRAKCNIGHDNE